MAHTDLTIRTLRAVDQALRRKLALDVNAGIITFHVLGLAGVLSPMGQNALLGIIFVVCSSLSLNKMTALQHVTCLASRGGTTAVLRCRRRGSRCCCSGPSARRCCDTPAGSCPPRCPNSRPVSRGSRLTRQRECSPVSQDRCSPCRRAP